MIHTLIVLYGYIYNSYVGYIIYQYQSELSKKRALKGGNIERERPPPPPPVLPHTNPDLNTDTNMKNTDTNIPIGTPPVTVTLHKNPDSNTDTNMKNIDFTQRFESVPRDFTPFEGSREGIFLNSSELITDSSYSSNQDLFDGSIDCSSRKKVLQLKLKRKIAELDLVVKSWNKTAVNHNGSRSNSNDSYGINHIGSLIIDNVSGCVQGVQGMDSTSQQIGKSDGSHGSHGSLSDSDTIDSGVYHIERTLFTFACFARLLDYLYLCDIRI